MRTLLFNVFGQLVPSPGEFAARCQIADTTYLGVSAEFVRQAILTDPVLAPVNYVNDLFDCDDYVQYLRTRMALLGANRRLAAPLAVGFILTAEHAFNFCVGPTGQLTLINTQSDDRAVVSDPSAFAAFMWVSNANRVQSIYV
ncbi:MAG TPA: hypothetical protein VEA69_02990 [Tepidisphaeraceae bacterium]|nr:hypothetical protein [Tepidisphaeraceae bacterium]